MNFVNLMAITIILLLLSLLYVYYFCWFWLAILISRVKRWHALRRYFQRIVRYPSQKQSEWFGGLFGILLVELPLFGTRSQ
jgi:hypothetical protein